MRFAYAQLHPPARPLREGRAPARLNAPNATARRAMYPRRLGAWRPNGLGPQHHAPPGGTRSVASVHTDRRPPICVDPCQANPYLWRSMVNFLPPHCLPLNTLKTTEHTEMPFRRHGGGREREALRTLQPYFRLIILIYGASVPKHSEAKSRI